MSGAIEVRGATGSDQPAIERCVHLAYAPYIAGTGEEPAPMFSDYRALIERGVVHVADTASGLVGLIVMWAEPDLLRGQHRC